MIPFLDLAVPTVAVRPALDESLAGILDSGGFTLGAAVARFEKARADYCGVDPFVGVNSEADTRHPALLAAGIGPGDEVIPPPMTFIATEAVPRYVGAAPVFADIEPMTWNLDPGKAAHAIPPEPDPRCPYISMAGWPPACVPDSP